MKRIIFDLDNTMWRGLIGEHYEPDAAWPQMPTLVLVRLPTSIK